jgi:solute:Na+ symporter, SSS family
LGYFSNFDLIVIGIYFSILVGLGLYLKKRASASLEDYFLGGKQLPWYFLGISGMAWSLDVAGTVLIVSLLFILGPRGLFIEFRGGANLILIFMMLWTGKWHRRSGCMTVAEWSIFRFGSGWAGQAARMMTAIALVCFLVGMLGYLVKGVGIFLSTFIDLPPVYCSLILVTIATIYTVISGFYGVVFTDVFQSGIILSAVIGITAMAVYQVVGYDGSLGELAANVTGNTKWFSSVPHVHTEMPPGYENYQPLLLLTGFYLLRVIMAGISSGEDQRAISGPAMTGNAGC